MNAAATATPPPRGSGTRLTRRWSGRSTASTRSATPADERREDERDERRGDEGGDHVRARPPERRAVNLTRQARRRSTPGGRGPEPGSRPISSATRAASRLAAAGVAALLDRVDDQLADLAHLVRPIPRDVTAGVPTRMPDDVFGGWRSNGICVLVDGDPDLVEERARPPCR